MQSAMSFSVLESIFSIWLQMLVPMSQATIQVFLCTASLRRQLCHFRIQIALGWNWLSRVEMHEGMVDGRVGFLVAGLWEGVCGIIEKLIFRPAIFCMLPFNVASHLCCYFGVFAFFRVRGGLAHHKKNNPMDMFMEWWSSNIELILRRKKRCVWKARGAPWIPLR